MKQIDTQTRKSDQAKEINPRKKRIMIMISIILATVILTATALAYVNLYKIPHSEAVANLNAAVEKYNAEIANFDIAAKKYSVEVTALAERNKELDNAIETLNQVINAENIPVDELLLTEAQSVLTEARKFPKDSAPEIPDLSKITNDMAATMSNIPMSTDMVIAATSRIVALTDEVIAETVNISLLTDNVRAMGNYSNILTTIRATETKYRSMIESFSGCDAEVLWVGVDKEHTVLRFVIKLSNPNDYTLKGVTTEWVAYDVDGAIVGSFDGTQPDIPENGYVYYVGGAGSANLTGIPVRIEVNVTTEGLLTNRVSPQITVNNVKVTEKGWGGYSVSANCITDSIINTANLGGQFIIKDADGQIIDADFWNAENLPDSIDADGMFKVSVSFYDLPAIPENAEVYMYYKWE